LVFYAVIEFTMSIFVTIPALTMKP